MSSGPLRGGVGGTGKATDPGNQLRPEYVDSAFNLWLLTGKELYRERASVMTTCARSARPASRTAGPSSPTSPPHRRRSAT